LNRDEKTGIIYNSWRCAFPEAVVLLVHGLGGNSSRWEYLARFLLEKNITSYAIELKGFGETEGLKGHIDSFRIYYRDIQSLYDIIERENSGEKIFLIGESMGGLISFVLAGLKPDLFSGVICISPNFKSTLKFSWSDHLKIYFSMVFNPRRQFEMPFDSRMCTRDPECQKLMDTDPLEYRLATASLLFNVLLAQRQAHSLKNKIRKPVLFLLAGDNDQLSDSAQSKKVFKDLKTEDKEIIQYPQMYHALSIESGREKVFEDILKWLRKRYYP
jgi:alpha-beta hydrolase superfamily lysophospholipase